MKKKKPKPIIYQIENLTPDDISEIQPRALKILDAICQCFFELRAMPTHIIKMCLFYSHGPKVDWKFSFQIRKCTGVHSVRQKKN